MLDYIVPYVFPISFGVVIFWLWITILYRDGEKLKAVFLACIFVAGSGFLILDAEVRTGKSQVAVATSCWPREYKKPSGCRFLREDGVYDTSPAPEGLRPGDKVVMVELKTKFTGRQYYLYSGRYVQGK